MKWTVKRLKSYDDEGVALGTYEADTVHEALEMACRAHVVDDFTTPILIAIPHEHPVPEKAPIPGNIRKESKP